MKLTPWYPGTVKPVRKGVYQRQYSFGNPYCYWTGRRWCMCEPNPERAACSTEIISGFDRLPWRGLTEKAR